MTISLPDKSGAFYLYAIPNLFSTQVITAVGRDATGHQVSRSVAVTSPNGAQYFGFYNTTFGTVTSITVSKPATDAFGLGVGEFGDVGATVCAWLGAKHPGKGAPGTPIIEP